MISEYTQKHIEYVETPTVSKTNFSNPLYPLKGLTLVRSYPTYRIVNFQNGTFKCFS